MRIEVFEVRFDNTHAIYTAGQTVTGHVVIKLTKATWIDCVLIQFNGKARSRWEVNNGDSTKTYQANEIYIDCEYCLYISQNDSQKHPPGTHVYPFDFTLPPEVPSSFEGRRGFIRYNCIVALDRGWKGRLEVEQDLTVIRHLDVAVMPDAGMPANVEDEDSYEGCCCDSGVVTASLRLQKRGFVSGEPCYFDVHVNNQATSSIRGICLLLVQTVHYTGYSHSLFSSGNPKFHDKVNNWTMFELEEEISSMRTHHFSNCCVIPAVAPSLLEGCNIIELVYEIQMQVPVGWRTMQVSCPIYIGTIPLRLSEHTSQSQNAGAVPSSFQPRLGENSSSPPVRSNVEAPPSYEECVFGRMESLEGHNDNDEHNLDEDNLTATDNSAASRRSRFHRLPSYPYYSMSHFTNNNPVHDSNSTSGTEAHTPVGAPPVSAPVHDPLLMPPSQDGSSLDSLPPPPSYESLQNTSMDAQTRLLNS